MPETLASVRSLIADAADRLSGDTPRLDAEVLLGAVLGVDRARLVIDGTTGVPPSRAAEFDALVERRSAGEPVAYLIGRRDFRHLTLAVDPRVLIPRPETELLVEVALALAPGARVLDVGTGSGAVALALAQERPDLEVWASDVSAGALVVARANADALGLAVRFHACDLLDGLPGPVDAVVANLPYVADGDPLPRDVAEFEPAGALFGGADGLDVVRRLIAQLGPVGWVALEIGSGQAPAVAGLLAGAGFRAVSCHRDLAGIDRVVVGER